MENQQTSILDSDLVPQKNTRRRELLPWWIKIFIWLFLIFGMVTPVVIILGLLRIPVYIALYGFETNTPISVAGLCLVGIFIFKGITALGLWTEKDWAITLGQIDAAMGIVICVFMMLIYPFIIHQSGSYFNIRLELFLLIPFLIKLRRISDDWKELECIRIN
jgi:hypothetical protein